ncbi:MAG: type II toxin-antitoxin system PemK/MazF family toxin [Thermoanaerobaculia bacterium]|nr:type II toxin-antitoxin system PemK/MazF family toxin [Thermoanaerobaculia bacterium]
MKRCEVWWANLPQPAGRRPVVLLSRDEAYAVRALVTVAPVTTRIRRIPAEVALGPEDGLPKVCVVNLDSIVTIPKADLDEPIALLRPEKARQVETAIRFAFGMGD